MQTNFKNLEKKIKNYMIRYGRTYCKTLVLTYMDEISKRMDYAIDNYYNSYDPIYYTRTNKMRHGVYKKYTKITGYPDEYKAGIILDRRYYGSSYLNAGTSTNNIYMWSVLQGNHGREVVGDYHMDDKSTIYVNSKGKGNFGTGRRKIYEDKISHYIKGNHYVTPSPEDSAGISPFNMTLKYNIKAFDIAQKEALKRANDLLKPGYYW